MCLEVISHVGDLLGGNVLRYIVAIFPALEIAAWTF
jgi:hypothetical protein